MGSEFVREIKGNKYKYLVYWDKTEKKQKQKYLGRVDIEKTAVLMTPNEKKLQRP